MQKGIKTLSAKRIFTRLSLDDPTAEMQKGIKTYFLKYSLRVPSYDPTAEMQKGIKTQLLLPKIFERKEWPDRRNAKGD